MSSGDGRERHPREMTVPQPKSLSPSSSVGPRPSEEASGKEGRRRDMAENIVEEARRSITPPQPAEARRGSGIGSMERHDIADLNSREMSFFVPLILLMVMMGMASPWFTARIDPAVTL